MFISFASLSNNKASLKNSPPLSATAPIRTSRLRPQINCSNSWKFDPKTVFGFDEEIEKGIRKEVWESPPKNVNISNYAFEIIRPSTISGIISATEAIFKTAIYNFISDNPVGLFSSVHFKKMFIQKKI